MTINDKKQYLSKYRLQQAKINRITEMLELFPDNKDKYREELINARLLRDRIEIEIEAIGDDTLCEILSQKYMCGKTLGEIAIYMNYSKRHIERLYRKALERFELG